MFGKSVPRRIRSPRASRRGSSGRGNGHFSSVKPANAIVVSSSTDGYRSAISRNSVYSGMPR